MVPLCFHKIPIHTRFFLDCEKLIKIAHANNNMAGGGRNRWNALDSNKKDRPGRQFCSYEMMCDLACFLLLGIVACYFLKYFISRIILSE